MPSRYRLLIYLLCLHLVSTAGNKVDIKPKPSWLLPAVVDPTRSADPNKVSNGLYYDLIDRQVNLDLQSEYYHVIRHITNESGVQDGSEVSVTFCPQFQHVQFHIVSIIRNGQTVNHLTPGAIKTADDESETPEYLYNGTRRAYIILKNVQKGDQIEYSYTIIGFNPVFESIYSDENYFASGTPVLNYYLSYQSGSGRKLNYKLFNGAVEPAVTVSGSSIVYQWKNPPLENKTTGSETPAWYTNKAHVALTEFKDWKQVNDWALTIFNNYQSRLPEKLMQKIDSWKKTSAGDQDVFANLALRFVQDQIRYLGLEIGVNTHKPHDPGDVFEKRFGDCKDKAFLLTAILRHENIKAFVALANTLERGNLSQSIPSGSAFNHAIVALQRGNNFVFLDPTASLQRGELINNYIPAYGWALVVQPGGNALSPIEPGFLNFTQITENLKVSFEDPSSLTVTSVFKGGAADDMRNNLSESSLKNMTEGYLDYYKKLFEGSEADSTISVSDDSLKNEIETREYYRIPKIWQKNQDGKIELRVYAKLIAARFPDPVGHSESEPIAIDFPVTTEYNLRLMMPQDWPLGIQEVHIKNSSYQFDFTPVENGNRLSFKYYFKSFRDIIPAADVAQYKLDYKEIANCFSLSFTKTDFNSPPSKKNLKPGGNTNWIMIWIIFFFGVLMTMLFNYLNRRSGNEIFAGGPPEPLQGAVILLGISLGIRILVQGYFLLKQNYFNQNIWNQLGIVGGSSLQSSFIIEMLISSFSMASTAALFFWFLKKRDIFPKMFIGATVAILIGQILLILIYYSVKTSDLSTVRKDAVTQLTRSLVYAFIWITFIMKSDRVKQIFTCPYNKEELKQR